jgi:hypothetical protein
MHFPVGKWNMQTCKSDLPTCIWEMLTGKYEMQDG